MKKILLALLLHMMIMYAKNLFQEEEKESIQMTATVNHTVKPVKKNRVLIHPIQGIKILKEKDDNPQYPAANLEVKNGGFLRMNP